MREHEHWAWCAACGKELFRCNCYEGEDHYGYDLCANCEHLEAMNDDG